MKNMNKVIICGNVVSDAVFKKVCRFSIASNTIAKDSDGEWSDYANFFDCVIFGKFGESMEEYLTKGTKVCIEGTLHQNRWEDEDGNKRAKVEIYVDNIELMAKSKEDAKKGYRR